MTQCCIGDGLKMFGEKGIETVQAELEQVYDRNVLFPLEPESMSRFEKSRALKYLMFLKEKQDGSIESRGCAGGRKQRGLFHKDNASSPTMSTEILFLTATIAAKEKMKVTVVGVSVTYLQTDQKDEKVVVRLEGKLSELLKMIDLKRYRKFLTIENVKKVLYAELAEVLYGFLGVFFLFWEVSAHLVYQ